MEKEEDCSKDFRDKTAVALSYDPSDKAPKIIASGKGYLAEKIINAAKVSDIPLHQDAALSNSLSKIQIGDYIPQELYKIVAEILIFVDNLDELKSKVE